MPYPTDFAPPTPAEYIVHIWRRAWLLALVAIVAIPVAWVLSARAGAAEYSSTAQILVRPRVDAPEAGRGAEPLPTPAFHALFVADETIAATRDAYNAVAEKQPGLAKLEGAPDQLRGRFRTAVATTVDTTVYTQFSPVIDLTVTAGDAAQARALLEAWCDVVMARFGNLLEDEAAETRQRLAGRAEALTKSRAELLTDRYGLESQLLMAEATLAATRLRLTGIDSPPPARPPSLEPLAAPAAPEPRPASVPSTSPSMLESLAAQRDILRGKLLLSEGNTKESYSQQLQVIDTEILAANETMARLATDAAGVAARLGLVESQLAALDAQMTSVLTALRDPRLAAGVGTTPADGGTLRLLSRGMEPGIARTASRSMLPFLAALAAIAGTLVLLIAELYLRRALAAHPR